MKRLVFILSLVLLLCGCAPQLSESPSPEEFIDTDYFLLTLPQSWRGVTVNKVIPDGNRYAIECYERQDYELSGAGKLCTIKLFAEGENFTVYDHAGYGKLIIKDTTYDVVVIYPDEVTYTHANAQQYKALSQSINELASSLEPKDGCEYLIPQLEVPAEEVEDIVIETAYYTLTLPVDFYNNCELQIFPADEERPDTLAMYELSSFKTECGGHLCSILLIPHGEDYDFYPAYEWIGVLETPEGDFDIVALFPTDVQFSEETAAEYNRLVQYVQDVLYSLRPKDGIGLVLP